MITVDLNRFQQELIERRNEKLDQNLSIFSSGAMRLVEFEYFEWLKEVASSW